MNEENIKKIVEELCAADGALRRKERELAALVRELVVKPSVKPDPDFERALRMQLIAELSRRKVVDRSVGRLVPRFGNFILSSIAVIAVAFAVWFGFSALHPQKENNNVVALLPAVTITRVGDHAFGTIAVAPSPRTVSVPKVENVQALMQPMAGPVALPTGESSATSSEEMNAKMQIMSLSPTPAAPSSASPAAIGYVYRGEAFSQSDAAVDVLKRTTSTFSLGDVAAILGKTGFGYAGTSSFGNAAITNLTFVQDEDFGYLVTVDLSGGNVSIDPAPGRWPSVAGNAVSKSLSSSSALGIANQFLKDHGINAADYGEAKVLGSGAAVSVFYPEVVNGREVYAMDGEKIGLTVEVNAQYGRVESVHGLSVQNYEASSYGAIVDTAKIISLAKQEAGSGVVSAGTGIQELGLGTPIRAYVDEDKGLLVPAFAFPIQGQGSAAPSIIVPLVEN